MLESRSSARAVDGSPPRAALRRAGRRSHTQLPWLLLAGAVVLAVAARVLIAALGLPGVVNFAHFPLVLAAYLLARNPLCGGIVRTTERLLVVSGVLALASLAGSPDSSFLKAALLWPILAEPILVILTIWHLCAAGERPSSFRRLALILVMVQVPIALAQAATQGLGDPVQGTLIQSGAGHHVLGGIGLMAALVALARIVSGRRRLTSSYAVIAVAGFLLPVLSDMKQGIAAFFVAAVFVLMSGLNERFRDKGLDRRARVLRLTGGVLAGLLVSALLMYNLFWILAEEPWRWTAPLEAKGMTVQRLVEEMNHNPLAYLVGLGPGTTATRVSWLSGPGAPASALQSFGLEPSSIAAELTLAWAANPLWQASSLSSPFSTWIGVFGDLGALGLAVLALLWFQPWRAARPAADGLGAKAVVLFTVLLGFLFNWMEEPALVLIAALFIGADSAAPTVVSRSQVAERTRPWAKIGRHASRQPTL